MVEIIKSSLRRWNGAYYDERLESYILTEIEIAGMLPPKSLDTITSKKGKVVGYSMFFEWDSEEDDEEK